MDGTVVAVSASPAHTFSKPNSASIRLIAGVGVEGDVHAGPTVRHRSRAARNAAEPNLRQVHLIHAELHTELGEAGFTVAPGSMGENITTSGINLPALPLGARLALGESAVVELTGLRDPCSQLDDFQQGLMQAVLDRDAAGNLVRKAGVMAIVVEGGDVRPGDPVRVQLPAGEPEALGPV